MTNALQGPSRIRFIDSVEKTIKFLGIYAELIEKGHGVDSDLAPLLRAAIKHLTPTDNVKEKMEDRPIPASIVKCLNMIQQSFLTETFTVSRNENNPNRYNIIMNGKYMVVAVTEELIEWIDTKVKGCSADEELISWISYLFPKLK